MEKTTITIEVPAQACGPVLLFEDRQLLREGVTIALEKAGIEVRAFGTADEARTAIQANGFKAALLDIVDQYSAPIGLDLAAEFRKCHPLEYIEVVTAFDEDRFRHRAAELGVDRYTVKPVASAKLVEHLKCGAVACRIKRIAKKHGVDSNDLNADVFKEFGLPLDSEVAKRHNANLQRFSMMLRSKMHQMETIDPLWVASLEQCAERLWDVLTKEGQSKCRSSIALLLLKSVRLLRDQEPSQDGLTAMLKVSEMLNSHGLSEAEIEKADDLLMEAGFDVVVELNDHDMRDDEPSS